MIQTKGHGGKQEQRIGTRNTLENSENTETRYKTTGIIKKIIHAL